MQETQETYAYIQFLTNGYSVTIALITHSFDVLQQIMKAMKIK